MNKETMNKTRLVEKLNEDLASEFQSIAQYVQHISSIKGAQYGQVVAEMREHLGQELEHAMTLAEQIDFLGGTPKCQVPAIEVEKNAAAALKQDLELESLQLTHYRERISEANDLGFPDVAEALSSLLTQTQDHVHDLRAALGKTA